MHVKGEDAVMQVGITIVSGHCSMILVPFSQSVAMVTLGTRTVTDAVKIIMQPMSEQETRNSFDAESLEVRLFKTNNY